MLVLCLLFSLPLAGLSSNRVQAVGPLPTTTFLRRVLCVLQARIVTLQASVPGCMSEVPTAVFKALVKPSSAPCSMLLYTDAACKAAVPIQSYASGSKYVLKQPAGEKVCAVQHLHAAWRLSQDQCSDRNRSAFMCIDPSSGRAALA